MYTEIVDQNIPEEVYTFTMDKYLELSNICASLWEDSPISYFTFAKVFDNGYCIDLTTSDDKTTPIECSKQWILYFYQQKMHEKTIAGRMKIGINYLNKLGGEISESAEASSRIFDIDNKLDFIQRGNGYFDQYGFGCSKKNIDQTSKFYVYHQDKLLKFVSYFQRQANDLIQAGYRHKITLPNYQTPENKVVRFLDKELSDTGYELSFTSKEFVVLILYAAGCTGKQIAEMLHKSEKTIETHLYNIREKTGHADRLSLKKYLIDQGWEGLEKFFFPYIPKEVSV